MLNVVKSEERHHQDFGWLDARWHFSFSDYHDPRNMNWGPLRVFNDDVIQGGQGFGAHPHRDMEIITYVIDGKLKHQDNAGNEGVIEPGEVQVMSAGKGIVHAEFNADAKKPVHLLQLWVMPRTKGLQPRWAQKKFAKAERSGKLLQVVGGDGKDATLQIDQDAAIYVSSLAAGQEVQHSSAAGRKAYVFLIAGEVKVNGMELVAGDQARISDETKLTLVASKDAELILLDLPA